MRNKTTFTEKVYIEAKPEDVWPNFADLALIQNFSPGVKKSYYTTEQKEGAGAGRHCDLTPFGSVEEVVEEWTENKSLAILITDGKGIPPIQDARGHFSLTPEGSGTVVRAEFSYGMKLGIIGSLMNRLIVKSQFQSGIRKLIKGLKGYVEEQVQESKVPPIASQERAAAGA